MRNDIHTSCMHQKLMNRQFPVSDLNKKRQKEGSEGEKFLSPGSALSRTEQSKGERERERANGTVPRVPEDTSHTHAPSSLFLSPY